jgi:hypothetical protein
MKITNNFIVKAHKVTTFLAVVGAFVSAFLIFIYAVDEVLRLDIAPQKVESVVLLAGIFFLVIMLPSLIASIVISGYRISQK